MARQAVQVLAAILVLLLLVVVALCLRPSLAGASRAGFRGGAPLRAQATIQGIPGNPVQGLVEFAENARGTVVTARLTGLTPGVHGFHIHEKGDTRQRCNAAGPHFNPQGHVHGGPRSARRHIGDLGNITAGPDGVALYRRVDPAVALKGPHSVVGRTVVVHEKPDDFGLGGTPESLETGSSGLRVGCGVIALL